MHKHFSSRIKIENSILIFVNKQLKVYSCATEFSHQLIWYTTFVRMHTFCAY